MDHRLQHAPCGYVSLTTQGIITDVNETFIEMVGYNRSELVGYHIESILTVANKFLFHTYFYPFIQLYGYVNEMYITLNANQGKDVPVLINGRQFNREGTEIIDCMIMQMEKRVEYEQELRMVKDHLEVALRDKESALAKLEQLHKEIEIKQEKLLILNHELERLAVTDELTGLKNRRFFLEKLDENIERFTNTQTPFSMLLIDIDHFKKINDTWGHLAGDQILRELAKVLEASISNDEGYVARYGGEEFIVILPNVDQESAILKAEVVREAIENGSWDLCVVTASIGVSTFSIKDNNISILAKADQALYTSKGNGRNCVTHFDNIENQGCPE